MLPLVIIEQIKQREEEQRRQQRQPFVQVPVPLPPERWSPSEDEESDRGSVIIEVA